MGILDWLILVLKEVVYFDFYLCNRGSLMIVLRYFYSGLGKFTSRRKHNIFVQTPKPTPPIMDRSNCRYKCDCPLESLFEAISSLVTILG